MTKKYKKSKVSVVYDKKNNNKIVVKYRKWKVFGIVSFIAATHVKHLLEYSCRHVG